MQVRDAARADARAMGGVLVRAFDEDPVMTWMFADAERRRRIYPRMMTALIKHTYLYKGGCQVAGGDGELLGVALWIPPGRAKVPLWRQLFAAPTMIANAGPVRFVRISRRGAQLDSVLKLAHPAEPHWYLSVLGTEPSAQGTGVGGALLRSRLAECDRDGLPAYLECVDANVPIYERFGFKVISDIQIPDGGPVLRGMWRA
ncbi:GNAT family N-acetyltransferase [Allokutzneria sp. A3M-2-11 16]|uniref:GNAT family N-acetyltransferase n=1 Tax=Allokutzneria sp. A3M-2-11 16 TaxID=2962043 RepID=UPI0020B774BC|nr:GNAT family N-acetyltransferase [Allokutzneria sp. A3M-2-11 16]